MFRISGRLADLEKVKEGESSYGKWKVMKFTISKSRYKKKVKICFTAKNRDVDFIKNLPKNEKIDIEFYPDCREYKGKWYVDLLVLSVEKYVARVKFEGFEKIENKDFNFEEEQLSLKLKNENKQEP